ncbi:MAG TPA: hypothetical protein VIU61_09200 [Kofleriaceae bacterium]
MKPAAFSFRNLPASIYLAVGLGVIGSVVYAIVFLSSSSIGADRFIETQRARIFNLGCQYAQVFLFSCGVFALARRHTGPARPLAQTAAWLMFVGLAGPFVNLFVSIIEPRNLTTFFDRIGLVEGFVLLAASILLTIAADAWRRVVPAAILLMLLHVTSYSFPVLGEVIRDVLGNDHTVLRIYSIVREILWCGTLLFVAAALAAGGRDLPPEPQRAASGFAIAHTSLIVRLVAAISLALMGFAAQSPGIAKLVLVIVPLVVIGTQVSLAIGVLRVDAAGVPGMPRFRLALAAAGIFWFASLQVEQLVYVIGELWDGRLEYDDVYRLDMFSVIGPIVVAISLALVGSAIASFAANRGNQQLASAATARMFAFVALALGGIALQAFMVDAGSRGSAGSIVAVSLVAGVAGVAALVVLAGLLKRASEQINTAPGIPPARIVSDS